VDGAIHWPCLHAPPPRPHCLPPPAQAKQDLLFCTWSQDQDSSCMLLCKSQHPDKETAGEGGVPVHPGVPEPSTGPTSNRGNQLMNK